MFLTHINYIKNTTIYYINNGVIEGTNNLIKCIKRIAFGTDVIIILFPEFFSLKA